MVNLTKSEFMKIVNLIQDLYPRSATMFQKKNVLRIWYDCFKHLPYGVLELAVIEHLKNYDRGITVAALLECSRAVRPKYNDMVAKQKGSTTEEKKNIAVMSAAAYLRELKAAPVPADPEQRERQLRGIERFEKALGTTLYAN